uniref:MSV199 domain-containing protein n=1 Tax=viral metagenome TaxID=1070528 RepID=A0A6C0KUI2_9ZZZZ
MDIYAKLCEEFTTEEQKIFLSNFRCYLNYDQEKDYVINFEDAVKHMGFTRKDHAKRLLSKHCFENIDYKILKKNLPPSGEKNLPRSGEQDSVTETRNKNFLLSPEEKNLSPSEEQDSQTNEIIINSQHGNKETIMMTPNTFKDFCMKANTENAKRIRKYYIKMESIMFKHLNEILLETQNKLKTANDKIKLLENKRPRNRHELGHVVYIVKDFTQENVYKVGSTENLNTREYAYHSHNSSRNNCRIIYTKRCKDKNVLEKTVHFKLRDYIHDNRHDWFKTDFEKIRKIIDKSQIHLDDEEMPFTIDENAFNTNIEETHSSTESENEESIIPETHNITNPLDFERFIEECCIIEDKDVCTSWIDINSKYRLWARATRNNYKEQLSAYLYNKGFSKGLMYDPDTKCNSQAFYGISIIPVEPIKLSENPTEIERFIFNNFKAIVTGRVSKKDIFAKYIELKNKDDPLYTKILHKDKKVINSYFEKHFLGTEIHDGQRIRFGFYGVSLIGTASEAIGKRINMGNRNKIEQISNETGEVIKIFDSMTEACAILGLTINKLSTCCTHKKEYNGFLFRKCE